MTSVQIFLSFAALIVPLVWAFTHHGSARVFGLMVSVPLYLFVVHGFSLVDLLTNPLSVVWPVCVLVVYALIRLFTWPRRRREA